MDLDELLIALGFAYDPAEMKKFKKDIAQTIRLVRRLTRQVALGSAALATFAAATTDATDEMGKLAEEIGDTVSDVDALHHAQQIAGGTADGMSSSLRTLSIRAAEAARGIGSGVEALGILGLSATDTSDKVKSARDLMIEVSGAIQGLDRARQLELTDKLGIREAIRLLQQGPEAIQALIADAKELGTITDLDAMISAQFQDSLFDLWRIIKQGARLVTRELAPVLNDIMADFAEWWKINRDLIEQNFPQYLETAVIGFRALAVAVAAYLALRLVSHFVTLASAVLRAGIFVTALKLALLALPAAVAALALLAEDAKVLFEGGDSFIGEMITKFPEWETQLRTAASVLAAMADTTGVILDGWSKIFALFGDNKDTGFAETLKTIPGFLGSVVKENLGFTKQEAEAFVLRANPGAVLPSGAAPAGEFNPLAFTRPGSGQQLIQGSSRLVPGLVPGGNTTNIDSVNITIDGGNNDPAAIAEETANAIQQAAEDLKTPVDL